MRIGIGYGAYCRGDDYEEGFKKMKSHGYDCVDYGHINNKNSELYKFHNEVKCTTPHLTEDSLKEYTRQALSFLIENREVLIEDGIGRISNSRRTSSADSSLSLASLTSSTPNGRTAASAPPLSASPFTTTDGLCLPSQTAAKKR